MDKECENLCAEMNKYPGIKTFESCCGHGETPYHVWFEAESLDNLPELIYYFHGCHCGYYDWKVNVTTDCTKSPVTFLIEGPIGAYHEAEYIAFLLQENLKS